MSPLIKYGLVFVGGVATGLLIAKLYAHSAAADAIHTGLSAIGLGGGVTETIVDRLALPEIA